MEDIQISVVVPTYNRPVLLKACLKSLVNQTLEKQLFELIVVSDGPDKESEKVVVEELKERAPAIRFLSLPNKSGPAAARNLGWKSASGTIIAFTDDDCLPDKNWLKNIVSRYNSQKEIAFTGRVIVPVSNHPTDFELNTKGLETGEFVTANCAVTKAALQTVGGFDEAFKAAWREDSDLHFKLIEWGIAIEKLDEAIVVHPVRKAPWAVSIQEQKKTQFNALLYKKHPSLYRQRIKSSPSWSYYFIILFFVVSLVGSLLEISWLMSIGLGGWFLLSSAFALKRLRVSRKTVSHIFEMIVTSIIIPFLSVYWTLRGAIKYRVLFF